MWEPPASGLTQVDRCGSLQPVVSHGWIGVGASSHGLTQVDSCGSP